MFRAVRCTTALLAVLAASACGTAPTAPAPARKADPQAVRAVPDSAVPTARVQVECDPETGVGCCYETVPWFC